jgi:hypothetical protein
MMNHLLLYRLSMAGNLMKQIIQVFQVVRHQSKGLASFTEQSRNNRKPPYLVYRFSWYPQNCIQSITVLA